MPVSQKQVLSRLLVFSPICLIILMLLTGAGCNTGATAPSATPTSPPVYTPSLPVVASTDSAEPATPTSAPATDSPEPAITPTEEAASTQVPDAGQWRQVDLAGKDVQDLAASTDNPGVVLATGPGGAWRGASEPTQVGDAATWDDYNKWASLPVKLSGRVTSGAVAGSDVMYITSHTGCASGLPMTLQRSTDKGKTWQEVPGESPPLTVTAVDDKTAYGITCAGVVRTSDSGATWTALPGAALENYNPNAIAASPDGKSLYVAYVSEGGTGRIMRSKDSGSAWTEITPKTEPGNELSAVSSLTFAPTFIEQQKGDGLYMVSDQGLWVLPSNSDEWKSLRKSNPKLENPERITALYVNSEPDPRSNSQGYIIYIATAALEGGNFQGTGVLRSTDGGATWEQFGNGLGQRVVNDIVFGPFMHKHPPEATGVLLAATNDGIWVAAR